MIPLGELGVDHETLAEVEVTSVIFKLSTGPGTKLKKKED